VTVSVIVPYRPDGGARDENWGFLRPKWEQLNYEVVTGCCAEGEWIKADALSDALTRAQGDIIIMADADVWCEGIEAAVIRVQTGLTWAIPHLAVHRLTERSTHALRNCDPLYEPEFDEHPYEGVVGGGLFVMRREAYEAAPLDRRFRGWGQEDWAAGMAWTTLYGLPWRGVDPLWHLWHPPMERMNRVVGSNENRALWERYRSAYRNRPRMRALVGEGVERS
jgi:hypothetical protein